MEEVRENARRPAVRHDRKTYGVHQMRRADRGRSGIAGPPVDTAAMRAHADVSKLPSRMRTYVGSQIHSPFAATSPLALATPLKRIRFECQPDREATEHLYVPVN
jgi:hypothetical protein